MPDRVRSVAAIVQDACIAALWVPRYDPNRAPAPRRVQRRPRPAYNADSNPCARTEKQTRERAKARRRNKSKRGYR